MRALNHALAVAAALAAVVSVGRGQQLSSQGLATAGDGEGIHLLDDRPWGDAVGTQQLADALQAVDAVAMQLPVLNSPDATKTVTDATAVVAATRQSGTDDVVEAIQELAEAAKAMNTATGQMNKAISDAAAIIMEELEAANAAAKPAQQLATTTATAAATTTGMLTQQVNSGNVEVRTFTCVHASACVITYPRTYHSLRLF
jgi:hypothetical protein